MFTVCIFMYASLFATHAADTSCREKLNAFDVLHLQDECRAIAKDPLTTCEMVRLTEDKYAVYIRKLEGT